MHHGSFHFRYGSKGEHTKDRSPGNISWAVTLDKCS